ncbi:MAG TPA: histidine phosphatase family protein [Polyangiaceae bacterium]|nr:histidine phosphatase family protein [Polyangiaceae bacterium]
MRELLIIRHAIAHERDPSAWPNDDARPLTELGIKKFRQAARGLAQLVEAPEELLTSPLQRARQTASILEARAAFPAALVLEALRPDTEAAAVVAALNRRRAERIAIVGHEPDLSRLIGVLTSGLGARAVVEMKKGAVAHLTFAKRIEPGAGLLTALFPPRALRSVGKA